MRKEKQLLLDEVKGQINHFNSFVLLQYSGLTANAANEFRRNIAQSGGAFEVVRKRVLIKAADQAGVKLDLKTLPGHIGLVFTGSDPIETTKAVFKFSQANQKVIAVLAGQFDGQLYNATDVEKLSTLPSKDEMRAQLLGTLEAPMAQTLAVIEALLSSTIYCLDNKCKQSNA